MIALSLAFLWLGAVGIALFDGTRKPVGWTAVGLLAAATISTVVLGVDVYQHGTQEVTAGGWMPGIGITFRVDTLGILFAVLSQIVLLASLAFEVSQGVRARVLPALTLFMATGLTGLFFTGDAFNFYVFFEISMISAYIMTGYGENPRQFRAAFTFTAVNLLGSVFFLIGIAALYHNTGWLDMERIGQQMPLVAENPAILSATIIFIAFSIKLGLFPFHFWLPAVYTGTRGAVAAMLSGALANIGTYGIMRFGADIFPRELQQGSTVLLVLGTCSIIYGAMQALSRHSPNEVLAYSSIGQVGYILVAIAIGGKIGFAAAILYAVINSLNKTLLFLSASVRGLLVGAAFAVGAFSVAGVPPAGGFIGKLALFRASIDGDDVWLTTLLFVGGALSFVYMFQLYRRRYWIPENGESSPLGAQIVVAIVAVAIIGVGIWPQPLIEMSNRAAQVIPGGVAMIVVIQLAILTSAYLAILGSRAWEDAVTGLALAALLLWVYRRVMFPAPLVSTREVLVSIMQTPGFLWRFLLDVITGTWQVALYVLGIQHLSHPGILKIHYDEESRVRLGIALLALTISPGSFVVDVDEEAKIALVHFIDISDPEAVREKVLRTYFSVPGTTSVKVEAIRHA